MNKQAHAMCAESATSSGEKAPESKNLLRRFLGYMDCWLPAVKQVRTLEHLKKVMLGLMVCQGRSTLTNSIMYRGREQKDWSADYKLFNRSRLNTLTMFRTVLLSGIRRLPEGADIEVALDDTGLRKVGLKIPQARYIHDPLAPKFLEKRFCWGIRMLHAALILPRLKGERPLALSVGFQPIPAQAMPNDVALKAMTKTERAIWSARKKEAALTTKAGEMIRWLRETLDTYGYADRRLLIVGDGSFMNSTVAEMLPHNTVLVGRFQKNAKLYLPPKVKRGKTIYGDRIPTPEEHREQKLLKVDSAEMFYGGAVRQIKFMERKGVYWKTGTKSMLARMLIVMPIPYVVVGRRKRGYNKPGYLLTNDLETPAAVLIQAYLNRWQIEVLHRDLKDGLGVGQVQAFSHAANETVHSTMVAAYSLLQLSVHDMTMGYRDERFPSLPKWRRKPPMRASHRDLIAMLRNDLHKAGFFDEDRGVKLPAGWVLTHRETHQAN